MSNNKKIKNYISHLLNRKNIYLPFHEKTKIKKKENSLKEFTHVTFNPGYKAYSRFPVIPLIESVSRYKESNQFHSTDDLIDIDSLSTLFYTAKKIIEKDRSRRLFEIYYYSKTSSILKGLYHYYIRDHLLEKLPEQNTSLLSNLTVIRERKVTGFLFISLKLSLLPKVNKEWWYRINIAEGGIIRDKMVTIGQKNGFIFQSTDYYDDECNNFIGIDGIKESVIESIAVLSV